MILPLKAHELTFAAGGRTLIAPLSLEIAAGPSTVIVGANGAGKSVLMRLMHGLIAPSSGSILWSGDNARRKQAMVFQRPVLLRRSALANVTYALKLANVPRAERQGIALGGFGKRRPGLAREPAGEGAFRRRTAAAGAGAGVGSAPRSPVPRRADCQPRSELDARDRAGHPGVRRRGHQDHHGDAQPRPGATPRRRGAASCIRAGWWNARRSSSSFRGPHRPRRRHSSKESFRGSDSQDLPRPQPASGPSMLSNATSPWRRPLRPSSPGCSSTCCRCSREDRHPGPSRRARYRAGARHGPRAVTPTLCSCTRNRWRRSFSPKASASSALTSCTTTSC